MKNNNHLTEEKLGIILKELFPESLIKSQDKVLGKKVDYSITINSDDPRKKFWTEDLFNELNDMDGYFSEYDMSSLDCDEESEEFKEIEKINSEVEHKFLNKNVILLIEFDGHYHYSSSKNFERDYRGVVNIKYMQWNKMESNDDQPFIYLLRIPYWIQLDHTMTNLWFNVKKDYSCNFSHGFISSKCKLPECFSSDGELRFIKELESLPADISKIVTDSLLSKCKKTSTANIGSVNLICELSKFYVNSSNEHNDIEGSISDFKRYLKLKEGLKNKIEKNKFLYVLAALRHTQAKPNSSNKFPLDFQINP